MLIYVMSVYRCVNLLLLLSQKKFEYIVPDICPQGDVLLIVIGINSAQSEPRAALKAKGQIDVIPIPKI